MNKQLVEDKIKVLFEYWLKIKQLEQIDKVRYAGPVFEKEEYTAMLDAIFSDWWSGGKYTLDTERKLARVSERNSGLLTNSGSSANLLLMSAAKELYFNDGDKILTLSCGFPTTVNPIMSNNLVPVFVDIDIETLNLNPDTLKKSLENDPGIKGVFVAHTLGFHDDIDKMLDIARDFNVKVFFDCCDAYGSFYKDRPIQAYGKASTFSFYVAHHITCGEGGGIVTNDDELFIAMRSMRNWGRYCASPNCCIRSKHPDSFCPTIKLSKSTELPEDYSVNYQYEYLGYNLKPLELQAAMLGAQLDKIEQFSQIRKENYQTLYDYFAQCGTAFKIWPLAEGVSPFAFPLLIPSNAKFNRKHFVDFMTRNKIETRMLFGGNLMKHPAYANKKQYWEAQGTPHINADHIMKNFVMFGVSPVISKDQTMYICNKVNEFLEQWK